VSGGQVRARLRHERDVADPAALPDRGQQPVGDLGVPQPVVGQLPADRPDLDVLQLAAQVVAAAQDELVVLHRGAVGEGHRDQQQVQQRLAVGDQRGGRRHGHRPDRAALGGEPALFGQPAFEQSRELVGQRGHVLPSGCASSVRPRRRHRLRAVPGCPIAASDPDTSRPGGNCSGWSVAVPGRAGGVAGPALSARTRPG
jgi:hypothetical protein